MMQVQQKTPRTLVIEFLSAPFGGRVMGEGFFSPVVIADGTGLEVQTVRRVCKGKGFEVRKVGRLNTFRLRREERPAEAEEPINLRSAKNPKRPTVRELWRHVLYLRGEIAQGEKQYAATLEGQLAEMRDELGSLRSDVDMIKSDAEEAGYALDDLKSRADDLRSDVDELKSAT